MDYRMKFDQKSETIEADILPWIVALIVAAVISGIGLIVTFTSKSMAEDTLEFCLEQDPPPSSARLIIDSSTSWKKWFTTYEVECIWD